jgi:hypothetical protein
MQKKKKKEGEGRGHGERCINSEVPPLLDTHSFKGDLDARETSQGPRCPEEWSLAPCPLSHVGSSHRYKLKASERFELNNDALYVLAEESTIEGNADLPPLVVSWDSTSSDELESIELVQTLLDRMRAWGSESFQNGGNATTGDVITTYRFSPISLRANYCKWDDGRKVKNQYSVTRSPVV